MGNRVVDAATAVESIEDGQTVTVCGIIGGLCPDSVLRALGERFRQHGRPRDLTLIFPVAVGDVFETPGVDHIAEPGLLKKVIGGSFVIGRSSRTGAGPRMTDLILSNQVEAYNLPIGALMYLHREIATGRPGVITKVGLDTVADPRIDGGRLNEAAQEQLVRVISIDDEEYLFYPSFPIHVAIIRGSTADELGNISMEEEGFFSGVMYQALAAKACGGKVIAQVRRVVERRSLHPQLVRVPGSLVDFIVIDEMQLQLTGVRQDPSLSGQVRAPIDHVLSEIPLSAEKVVARRALQELSRGSTIILGFGIPSLVPSIAAEEGILERFTFTIEHGAHGGMPLSGFQFGASVNPEVILDGVAQFDFIDAGGAQSACLGFAEVDSRGRVNVGKVAGMIPGVGGFINITQSTPKVIFCGSFTAGARNIQISNGAVKIVTEGSIPKFVQELQQITFNPEAPKKPLEVIYVTERAVFRILDGRLAITEIAPGINLESDILSKMEFKPVVAGQLRTMDATLFGS